jgi:MFS family permease
MMTRIVQPSESTGQKSSTTPSFEYSKIRWAVLASVCLSVVAFQVATMSYSPILGEIAISLGIPLAQSVNLMSFYFLFAAISFFIAGPFCDRYGVAASITVSAALSTLPTVLTPAVGHSFTVIAALRAMQGLAVGFALAGLAPLVLQWFPPRQRGLALGVAGAFNPFGAMLGVVLSPILLKNSGDWQRTIAILSLFGWVALVYSLVIFRLARSRKPRTAVSEDKLGAAALFRAAMRSPVTWVGVLATFAVNWMMQSAFSLSPSYFAEAKPLGLGLGSLAAGQLMGIMQIAAIAGPVIGGLILDNVFHGRARGMLAIAFLLSLVFAALQFNDVYGNRSLFLMCLVLAGAGIGMLFPMVQSQINEIYDHRIIGRMNGIWLGMGSFGGSSGMFICAIALKQTGSYVLPINIISTGALLGAFLCLFFRPGVLKAS